MNAPGQTADASEPEPKTPAGETAPNASATPIGPAPPIGAVLAWLLLLGSYLALARPLVEVPMGPEEAFAVARSAELSAADSAGGAPRATPAWSGAWLGLGAPAHWRPVANAWIGFGAHSSPGDPSGLRGLRRLALGLPLLLALALGALARRLGGAPSAAWLAGIPPLVAPFHADLLTSPEGWSALLSTSLAAAALAVGVRPGLGRDGGVATGRSRVPGALEWLAIVLGGLSVGCGEAGAFLLVLSAPLFRLASGRRLPVAALALSGLGAFALGLRELLLRSEAGLLEDTARLDGGSPVLPGLLLLVLASCIVAPLSARDAREGWRAVGIAAVGLLWILLGVTLGRHQLGPLAGPAAVGIAALPAFAGAGLALGASVRSGAGHGAPLVLLLGVLVWGSEGVQASETLLDERIDTRTLWNAHLDRAMEGRTAPPPGPSVASVDTLGELPVLDSTVPTSIGGSWRAPLGVAAASVPPIGAAGRPIWPRKPLVGGSRPYLRRPHGGLLWPDAVRTRNVPRIPLTASEDDGGERTERPGSAPGGWDVRFEGIDVPALEAWGHFPDKRFELVLFSAHGFAAEALPTGVEEQALGPTGGTMTRRTFDASSLLAGDGPVGRALRCADAWGERLVFLELRAVDDARGVRHRPVASSDWWPLTWTELPAR